MGEFRLSDEVTYVLRQHMDPFIRLLLQVQYKLIPMSPEVLFQLNCSHNPI